MAIALLRQRISEHLPAHSLRGRLFRGAFWSMTGMVVAQGIGAVTGIFVVRLLGRELNGELSIVQSTLAMFGVFAGLTLGYTANKHVAEFKQSDPDRAGRILGLASLVAIASGLTVTLLVVAFASQLATHSLHAPHLARYIRIAAPLLLLSAVAGVQNGALAGFEAFRQQSLWTGVVAAVNCAAAIFGAWRYRVEGAIWANVLSNCVAFVIYRTVLIGQCRRFGVRIHYRQAWREHPLLWSFALPSMLSGFMVAPVMWIAAAMLTRTPGGYAQLGLYDAANKWRIILMFFPAVIAAPLLPMMCQLYAQRQYDRVRTLLIRCMGLNVALVGSLALAIGIFGRYVMLLYGRDFISSGGVATLWMVLLVAVFLSAGTVIGDLLVSTGTMWMGVAFNAMWAALLLIATAFLAPRYGAFGLALSYAFAYAVQTGVQLLYFRMLYLRMKPVQMATGSA